jgi:hypothetical protein
MQQKLAQKEKASKEENLRMLAQRAREERAGIAPKPTAESRAAMKSSLAAYGSDSGSGSESEGSEEDEEARKIRDQMRQDKRREREREMRMSNMGTEQRAKQLARQQNRDISEKIALGLAKPTLSKESMLDSRLFNQESLSGGFADDESYNLYDRPLFQGSSAVAAIYKARGNITEGNEEAFGGGTDQGIGKALDNDRFGLGKVRIGFEGAAEQEVREGPVQFEKDTTDVFGLDEFFDEAKTGKKRGLDTSGYVYLLVHSFFSQPFILVLIQRWRTETSTVGEGCRAGVTIFVVSIILRMLCMLWFFFLVYKPCQTFYQRSCSKKRLCMVAPNAGDPPPLPPKPSRGSGVRAVLEYTGLPSSWLNKRPRLPSRNWLIFLTVTSSITGLYAYDRNQCKRIRREYVDRVKHLADQPIDNMDWPRKVSVYGCKWPGDEDHERSMRYFRKYVKVRLY